MKIDSWKIREYKPCAYFQTSCKKMVTFNTTVALWKDYRSPIIKVS